MGLDLIFGLSDTWAKRYCLPLNHQIWHQYPFSGSILDPINPQKVLIDMPQVGGHYTEWYRRSFSSGKLGRYWSWSTVFKQPQNAQFSCNDTYKGPCTSFVPIWVTIELIGGTKWEKKKIVLVRRAWEMRTKILQEVARQRKQPLWTPETVLKCRMG
jgi:hypothetical protein